MFCSKALQQQVKQSFLSILNQGFKEFGYQGLYLGVNEPISLIFKYLSNFDFLEKPGDGEEGLSYINLREKLDLKNKSDKIKINNLVSEIKNLIEDYNSKLVVVDSVFSFYLYCNIQVNHKRFIYELVNELRNEELIIIFISGEEFEKDYIVPFDTVINFYPLTDTESSVVSKIKVINRRGKSFLKTKNNLKITDHKIEIYPSGESKEEKLVEEEKTDERKESYVKRSIRDKIKKIEKIEDKLINRAEFGASEEIILSFSNRDEFNEFSNNQISLKNNIKLGEPKEKGEKIWVRAKISAPTEKGV